MKKERGGLRQLALSPREVAELYGCSVSHVRNRIAQRTLSAVKVSPGRWVLLFGDLEQMAPWGKREPIIMDGRDLLEVVAAFVDRVTLTDAAYSIGLSPATLRRLRDKGEFPAELYGRSWIVTGEAFAKWLGDRRVPARWEKKREKRGVKHG